MSVIKIKETKNRGAQLSQGSIFVIANKFKIKRGANIGNDLMVVRLSEIEGNPETPSQPIFKEIKSFLLTPKEYDEWIALLIQVGTRPAYEEKEGEKPHV